ncbi:MAG: hypothetical protein M3Y64_00045, partial [Gemmatimonadota bacterium]|nr:hypothetical protein [Gemmatimonadota bacterium]
CALLVNASSGGSATIVVGNGAGLCGRTVTVQAIPDRNYVFTSFTENGAVVSLVNPFTTSVSGNRALVANFAIAQCALYIVESEGGGATVTGGNEIGNCGRSITVKATPIANYLFSGWSDASRTNPYTFELSTNVDLAPLFVPILCKLTLNNVPGGNAVITGGGATGQCGRSVTVVATPANNSTFTSWSNGATANPQTFALNQDLTLSPNYAGVLCTLTLGPVPNGTISILSGSLSGACGRSISLVAAPTANFEFTSWSNGATTNPYAVSLTGDLTLSANFTALQCAVTLNSSAGGTTAIMTGAVSGDCGRSVIVQATPAANFTFLNWTDGGSELSKTALYSLTVGRNVTITGNFQAAINVQDIANRLMSGFVSGTLTFSATERQYIDSQGNSNGSVDLGDLLALVQKNPSITLGADALLKIMSDPKASTIRIPVANNRQP